MKILYDYAMKHVGLPYRWGGDNPVEGYDCSGFVIELLKSVGELGHNVDMTSQGLFDHYEKQGVQNSYGLGSLSFYGMSATKIRHVGFCLDEYRMVEAGGGTSTTTNVTEAIKQNAFIRIRPIKSRKDFVGLLRPRYNSIGYLGPMGAPWK